MSDLSLPPLKMLLPAEADGTASASAFAWPTPPHGVHGPAQALGAAEPAELEGPNGTVTLCRLLEVDPAAGTLQVQTSSSRRTLTLKLTQFRRLTLLRPLKPLEESGGRPKGQLQLVRISFRDGHASEVKSIAHVELPIGHFTFSPLNAQGHLLRSFYPRPMVSQLSVVDLGRTSVDKLLAAAQASQPARPSARAAAPASDASGASLSNARNEGQPPPGAMPSLADAPPRSATPASTPASTPAPAPADMGLAFDPPAELPARPARMGPAATAAAAAANAGLPRLADPLPPLDFDSGGSGSRNSGEETPATKTSSRLRGLGSPPPAALAQLPELTEVLNLVEPGGTPAPAPAAPASDTGPPSVSPLTMAPLSAEPAASASAANAPKSISDMLQVQQIDTPPKLLEAIEQQARMPMVRIGEALMALGYLTEQKLGDALQAQSRDRSLPLGELLVRRGDVSRTNLQTALARKMGYPVVDVVRFPIDPDAVKRVPLAMARRLPALPLMQHQGRVVVAFEDPSARNLIDEIEFTAQCKLVPVMARTGTLLGAIEAAYMQTSNETIEPGEDLRFSFNGPDAELSTDKLLDKLEQEDTDSDSGPVIEQSDNSLVRLINTMIVEARQQGVSDIHIECPPPPQKVKVRFRRDGVLKPYLELPPGYRQAIVARIKIMCDLDISERRKPQDGKITFSRFMKGHKLELRVATIPTAGGLEDVVMRLLSSAKALPLESLALAPDILNQFKAVSERPYGLLLCVGPTGSGKTTTLHAALAHINTPERKIWTAEDPVEITQPGLRQVQVNAKIDWTFAKALRAFLRADPDVVMVGEVRDEETASMAVEASLTGHLVLSTLHTNSAPETVTRLLDMGMDPFSFADSLLAVLAQRLVRRWCRDCVTSEPADEDWVRSIKNEYLQSYPDENLRPEREALLARWVKNFGHNGQLMRRHAAGCKSCGHSGYNGRVGLHELLTVTRELRVLIQQKAPPAEIQRQAMVDGMRTLRQDGLLKVLAGLTSIEEVRAISNQ